MNRGVDNFRFRDPRRRRFTPDTIIAQTGSLLLPFHSHGDRCDPSYRYCYCFNPHLSLSFSTGGFHSLDAVQKGTLKWESSLELSSYRSVVGQFGSSNCAMNTTYRPGGILTEERCNPTHRHPFY